MKLLLLLCFFCKTGFAQTNSVPDEDINKIIKAFKHIANLNNAKIIKEDLF